MSPRGRPKKEFPPIEDLPEDFRFAMINLMAKFNIKDIGEAYDRAAMLININSEIFEKQANNEGEQRYHSRHLTELNKARSTIEKKSRDLGYTWGSNEANKKNRIWYFCSKCGDPIYLEPDSESHKALIQYMREHVWQHGECPKRKQ